MTTFIGTPGNDTFLGGTDSDTVILAGSADGYRIHWVNGQVRIVDINTGDGDTGLDILTSIETLTFADRSFQIGELLSNGKTGGDFVRAGGSPATTALGAGGYALAFTSDDAEQVFAQRYDVGGNALGSLITVGSVGIYIADVAITTLKNGSFVVTWSDGNWNGTESTHDVYMRHFSAGGNPLSAATKVNVEASGESTQPAIAALANGGFVITWEADLISTHTSADVFAQRFNGSGAKVGGQISVNSNTIYTQQDPSVTGLADGGFVVVWEEPDQDLVTQRFSATGARVGDQNTIFNGASVNEYEPDIQALPDGSYLVAYGTSVHSDEGYGLMVHRFNSAGNPVGGAVRLSPAPGNYMQDHPDIAVLADGTYVVTWGSYGGDETEAFAIYAQRFNASGARLGAEVRIDSGSGDSEINDPDVTALSGGGYLISWEDDGDIYSQRFTADGSPAPVSALGITGTSGDDTINGGGGMQVINGLVGNDIINSSGGDDVLKGGQGNDTLTSGSGRDVIVFNTTPNASSNVDRLTDFSKALDKIHLENAVFTKLLATGALAAANFRANLTGQAQDANDYIIYDKGTGQLFYDADGSGAGARVQIALMGNHAALTAANFEVI